MTSLQEMVSDAKPGDIIDLGSGDYSLGTSPLTQYPLRIGGKNLTITGNGAHINVGKSSLRSRPAIMIRGAYISLLGDVTVHHQKIAKRDDLEAQHGIELQGADNPTIAWKIEEAQGTSYYVGKNPITNAPCKNVKLVSPSSVNPGRQHIALQAVQKASITKPYMDNCGIGHSSIVFEPNGHTDMCQDVLITDGLYKGNTGWCFGSLGLGDHQPYYNLARVKMINMHSKGLMNIRIAHGIGQRRGPFGAYNCSGEQVANLPTVHCQGVDGLTIVDYFQPASKGVNVFGDIRDCTKVLTTLRTA